MKTLNGISKYIVGIVFIFSGFVKAVDPLGSTYKFLDYFEAFGMDFFSLFAFPLAIILSGLGEPHWIDRKIIIKWML